MLSNAKERIDGLCSVIMPAYNNEKYVSSAIQSVLEQSYGKLELIIIDDASVDETAKIVMEKQAEDSRIQYYRLSKNQGCAYARNLGLEKAKGEYIAFLDSDDYWCKSKLQKQITILKNKQHTLCATAYEMIDDNDKITKHRKIKVNITYTDLLKENSIIFSTVVCRFVDIQNMKFKDDWYHEDYVFLLDCVNSGLLLYGIDVPLTYYRVHSKGRSFNKFKAAYNRWRIYNKYLQMSVSESVRYFMSYALHGVIKYI